MIGFRFTNYIPDDTEKEPFEKLLKIFKELLLHTSGNVSEALSWLTELDKEYKLTNTAYGIADFIEDLKTKGYIVWPGQATSYKMGMLKILELRKKAQDALGKKFDIRKA